VVDLPTGTVTFLFTDIEGSTRLWEEHPDEMRRALARHDALLTDAIGMHGGSVVKTTGDGIHAVFPVAASGVAAAIDGQLALMNEPWDVCPIRVRMGLHTGAAELRDGDYYGSVLNRAARLMSVAHGGQVVVSQLTEELARDALGRDVELLDLGDHRLRDLAEPIRVFQVSHRDLEHTFPPLRSVDLGSGNLPVQISSFVGRERDLARLRDLVKERRLLTLTGVGGVGKTRLALQAVVEAQPDFPGGAWVVELARTGDPAAVGSVVSGALGAPPQAGRSDVDVVCDYLGATRSVLVLDNCEHVLDAAADVAAAVLERCPAVLVVATSREPLDLEGEQVVPVRPLDADTDAVSLFVERAQSTDPEFEADDATIVAVEEICTRLDGVPLAIELAAARVDTMTPADIAARLDDRFRLLSSGRRRSVDRHQTLRATLEWSHHLLAEDERVLLRRLGVFAGGFTAAAARAVCGDDDALATLVRKSLVQFERVPRPGRYRLLETVRVFALEQLAAAGEAETIGRAHAEWIASLVDHPIESWAVLDGTVDRVAVQRELDNWREAMNFALTTEDTMLALRLSLHNLSAALPETGRWTEQALELNGMAELPGAYWLHYVTAIMWVNELDYERLAHEVRAFEAACADPRDRSWIAPFKAVCVQAGGGNPVAVVEAGLAIPGLSPVAFADLQLYRSLYRNLPPANDVEAARLTVRLLGETRGFALPVAYALLAMALRDNDPDAAMEALRTAEDLAERYGDPFLSASVSSWGSLVTLALRPEVAAGHLLARFDTLQPFYGLAAAARFTLCVCVLRLVRHPAAERLHAFVVATPEGINVVRSIAPDLATPVESTEPLLTFDRATALAREALADIVDGACASDVVETERAP
jgi:predicted ATPase/class 3 adenylate cyclase